MFFWTYSEDEKVLGERCSLLLTTEELRLVFVDLARKRRIRYRGKTYSNYLVERTVVFPEYTLPLDTNFHPRGISTWEILSSTASKVVRHP